MHSTSKHFQSRTSGPILYVYRLNCYSDQSPGNCWNILIKHWTKFKLYTRNYVSPSKRNFKKCLPSHFSRTLHLITNCCNLQKIHRPIAQVWRMFMFYCMFVGHISRVQITNENLMHYCMIEKSTAKFFFPMKMPTSKNIEMTSIFHSEWMLVTL